MSDFIREVDEDYRRDRAMAFLSRYQVLIAIVFVAIIAGAGGYRVWADKQVSNAEAVNDRFMAAGDLAKDGKAEAAEAGYAAIAKDGPAGYVLLARMHAAASLAGRDPEGAAKAFDAIASDDALPASMRDAARLRGAMIRIDTEEPKAFEQRYRRFGEPGFAFEDSMRELLGLAALKRQDFVAAGRYFDEIIIDPNAPAGIRGRASAFRTLVVAGTATQTKTQPPPASVKIVSEAAAPTPPAPSPLAPSPPAPSVAPVPPAASTKPEAVPPSIKPPGNAPPD